MNMKQPSSFPVRLILVCLFIFPPLLHAQEFLPSWNDNGSKQAILEYVHAVTTPGSPDFITVPDRVATFDVDGTLVTEKPLSLETYFMISSVKKILADAPDKEISHSQKTLAEGTDSEVDSMSGKDYDQAFAETYSGNSQEEFSSKVVNWAANWLHPRFKKGVSRLCYVPMKELMDFLRASGFTVFIVSGSNIDFIRPFSEELFGVPQNQVIGTESVLKYKVIDNKSYVVKQSRIDVVTVGPNKPIMIEKHIGRRPVFAAGNGTSDPEMLTYVSDGKRKNMCLLIHHDDPDREYQYTNGELVKLANQRGFVIVRMKEDWKTVFPE